MSTLLRSPSGRWRSVTPRRVRVVLAARKRRITAVRVQRCSRCGGSGLVAWLGWCRPCAGTGRATVWR